MTRRLPGRYVPSYRNLHAALFSFSAISTSMRKIPVAPLGGPFGPCRLSKNTTFISGRTRAPSVLADRADETLAIAENVIAERKHGGRRADFDTLDIAAPA